jgi:hypothetical protein
LAFLEIPVQLCKFSQQQQQQQQQQQSTTPTTSLYDTNTNSSEDRYGFTNVAKHLLFKYIFFHFFFLF